MTPNNVQIQQPGRNRQLRIRKRGKAQNPARSWQEFKSNPPGPGSQTNSTANRGTTSHNGAGTPMVPIKVGSADMEPAMKDQLPSARSGYLIWSCPESKRIPVCHYSLLGTVRSNSPVLTLTPYRACMLYLVSYPKRLVEGCTLLMNWPRFGGLFQGSITQLARAWKKLGTAPLSSLDPRIRSEI